MARKLKTYETSLGFFDLAIAAPSMKAALDAWGADSNLFHQGAAKQSEDPDVVAATMAKPGVVLKRPVGSNGHFKEHAELPRNLAGGGGAKKAARKPPSRKPQKHAKKKIADEGEDRKAALAFEKEQARRERERAKEEAALSLGDVISFFPDTLLENILSIGVLGVLDPTERFVLVT